MATGASSKTAYPAIASRLKTKCHNRSILRSIFTTRSYRSRRSASALIEMPSSSFWRSAATSMGAYGSFASIWILRVLVQTIVLPYFHHTPQPERAL
jgi:hypothetical protein